MIKGSFYSSFFQLSIGIERFLRLSSYSILMIENNLEARLPYTLKKFSHNIAELHKTVQTMVPAIYPIWSGN